MLKVQIIVPDVGFLKSKNIGDVIKIIESSGMDEELISDLIEVLRGAFQSWVIATEQLLQNCCI